MYNLLSISKLMQMHKTKNKKMRYYSICLLQVWPQMSSDFVGVFKTGFPLTFYMPYSVCLKDGTFISANLSSALGWWLGDIATSGDSKYVLEPSVLPPFSICGSRYHHLPPINRSSSVGHLDHENQSACLSAADLSNATQAGLELSTFLPRIPQCWNYICVLYMAQSPLLFLPSEKT